MEYAGSGLFTSWHVALDSANLSALSSGEQNILRHRNPDLIFRSLVHDSCLQSMSWLVVWNCAIVMIRSQAREQNSLGPNGSARANEAHNRGASNEKRIRCLSYRRAICMGNVVVAQ